MSRFLEGYYKANDCYYKFLKNEDGKFVASSASGTEFAMQVEYGDFGEADPEVEKRSGGKTYNVKLTLRIVNKEENNEKEGVADAKNFEFCDLGVIFAEGRKCSIKGFTGVAGLEKITNEEFEKMMNDFDPIEAPPGPYKVQPDKKGKILWFTGAPGMGKSTCAQLLARNHGYVYYEADCFGSLLNPYIPLDVDNPSMAKMYQKPVKGKGMEERRSLGRKYQEALVNLMQGKEYDKETLLEYYSLMAADIASEKKRIGGDFAVAHCLITADIRAAVRQHLGPDLIIIVLTMPTADIRERILARHQGDVKTADLFDHCEKFLEGVQENEPNTFEMRVDSAMTRDEVIDKIIEKLTN